MNAQMADNYKALSSVTTTVVVATTAQQHPFINKPQQNKTTARTSFMKHQKINWFKYFQVHTNLTCMP